MDFKTIELQLMQLEEAFSKSRSNIYSDNRKEAHFQELYALFKKIKLSDYKNFPITDLHINNFLLKFIFSGLEYLDNSTLNIIPYEIISCLEYALDDWIDHHNYIIVTSLSNKISDWYLETTVNEENFNIISKYIDSNYSLKISNRLIQISLPKSLSRDYLSCVVLYHELGHFVDKQLNISSRLLLKNHRVITPNNSIQQKYYSHKMEYFADLFASQYVNDSSNTYLNHIASTASDSSTHPATSLRIDTTNDFLNNESNVIISEFNEVLTISGLPLLEKRHIEIRIEDCTFQDLYPQKFASKNELHYVFKLGWEIWNNSSTNFLKGFSSRQQYNIINNLIEKSISNYVVQENWEKAGIEQ